MKNIHVLPTDKLSIIGFDSVKNLHFTNDFIDDYQNIYITSDEEIKEGDWILNETHNIEKAISHYNYKSLSSDCKKIILTTDQDLIKDGVQVIDDEFIEWFVKNPSCEHVTILQKGTTTIIFPTPKNDIISDFIKKEESKQETLEETAEKYANDWEEIHPKLNFEAMTPIAISKIDFIEGAKFKQQQIYNSIKELYDNENITGFSKRAYAKCLDIIEQIK